MNKRISHRAVLSLTAATAMVLLTGRSFSAVPNASIEVFTDSAKAGPDYAVQGEYAGIAGGKKLGAQVIALGNRGFQAVFLPGGLPGDGWDGKSRIRVDGSRIEESRTQFGTSGSGWNGAITAGKTFEGQTDQGTRFVLEKVLRKSPTFDQKPPEGAIVLFNGTNTDAWAGGKMTEDGLLQVGTRTKQSFQDFTLHLEFRTPFKPAAKGQARGNSGVYLLGKYEIQILDSFGLEGKDNECGGLYRQKAPAVNMCYPPLSWQTYDIDFQAARFENGQKTKNAAITVRHNGVVIHDQYELTGPTGGGRRTGESANAAPISLQNHGNPVVLRNIWILARK
jgi:3-keto-disaccharide hydrolase